MKQSVVLGLVIGCLIVAVSSECEATSVGDGRGPIIGHLRIDGVRELIVLLDPQGRTDFVRGDKATHSIPGCKRDVGRQGLEPGEDEDSGDYVDFVFSDALGGRYVVWIRPDSAATAQLSIELFSNATAAAAYCGKVGDEEKLRARRWYRVDVMLGARTTADTCGFSLGVPIKAQAPRTLRSL